MADSKLSKGTVTVIDAMFGIIEDSSHYKGMSEQEFNEWTTKFIKAKEDWKGYKTCHSL